MTFLDVVGRRICAVLAAGSASLHAAMLGHASGAATTGLLAVMIGACLFCALDLWRDGTVRAWVVVALMNLAMVALHLPAPAHHHGAAAPIQTSTLMTVATLLALVEVGAAATVLYIRSRARFGQLTDRPDR